jgi:hypothetical protein
MANGYHQSISRNSDRHFEVATIAAAEALRVLPYFEQHRPSDERPRRAIEALQRWIKGEEALGMADVRRLSLNAHAAARACSVDTAVFAARSAGQAIATWHVPTHWTGATSYAAKVDASAGIAVSQC